MTHTQARASAVGGVAADTHAPRALVLSESRRHTDRWFSLSAVRRPRCVAAEARRSHVTIDEWTCVLRVRRSSSGRTSWRGRAAPSCLQFLTTPVQVCSKMPPKRNQDSAGQSSKAAVTDGSSSVDSEEDSFVGGLDPKIWARPTRGQGARGSRTQRATRAGHAQAAPVRRGRNSQHQVKVRMVCMHEDYCAPVCPSTNKMCVRRMPVSRSMPGSQRSPRPLRTTWATTLGISPWTLQSQLRP